MDFETIYQISLGCTILYLLFIAWNFNIDNFMSAVVLKLLPVSLAVIILFHALLERGYVLKVVK